MDSYMVLMGVNISKYDLSRIEGVIDAIEKRKIVRRNQVQLVTPQVERDVIKVLDGLNEMICSVQFFNKTIQEAWLELHRPSIFFLYRRAVVLKLEGGVKFNTKQQRMLLNKVLLRILHSFSQAILKIEEIQDQDFEFDEE